MKKYETPIIKITSLETESIMQISGLTDITSTGLQKGSSIKEIEF